MASLLRLADTRRATPGLCAICGAAAKYWRRSGRRDTDADGITLAWRCCEEHESAAAAAERRMTIADVAKLTRSRPDALRRKASRVLGHAAAYGRASANLRGASSASVTCGIMAGYRRMEAEAMVALAAAIERLAGRGE